MQSTDSILMIRPAETVDAETTLREQIAAEFDAAAEVLREKGIGVFVIEDTIYPPKPDAFFPGDWVSFHEDRTVILYPMFATERRHERRLEIVEGLRTAFDVGEIADLSHHETEGHFLEGAGSMVLDRANRVAYASLSPRTDERLLSEVCERLGYEAIAFRSHGSSGREIDHTSTMLCVTDELAVVCLDAVTAKAERDLVAASLRDTGHQLIDITFDQMNGFAANLLQLRTNDGGEIVALSRTALDALSGRQRNIIERYCQLVPLDIPTIEAVGGRSVGSMIAEIFLPRHEVT